MGTGVRRTVRACNALSASAASSPMRSGRCDSVCPIFTNTGPRPESASLSCALRVRSIAGSFSSRRQRRTRRVPTRRTTARRAAIWPGRDLKKARSFALSNSPRRASYASRGGVSDVARLGALFFFLLLFSFASSSRRISATVSAVSSSGDSASRPRTRRSRFRRRSRRRRVLRLSSSSSSSDADDDAASTSAASTAAAPSSPPSPSPVWALSATPPPPLDDGDAARRTRRRLRSSASDDDGRFCDGVVATTTNDDIFFRLAAGLITRRGPTARDALAATRGGLHDARAGVSASAVMSPTVVPADGTSRALGEVVTRHFVCRWSFQCAPRHRTRKKITKFGRARSRIASQ